MKNMKKNNKGFTLVELIIVVAIIAVLASVLAPQYLKYVERSKESNDLQIATNIVRAATVAVADPINEMPSGYFVEVLWITGNESGAYAGVGQLMIRHPKGARISVYNVDASNPIVTPLPSSVSIDRLARNILSVFGAENITTIYNGEYVGDVQDGQSKLANEGNLAFHINTQTGEVALARLHSDTEAANKWIELGLPAVPAP